MLAFFTYKTIVKSRDKQIGVKGLADSGLKKNLESILRVKPKNTADIYTIHINIYWIFPLTISVHVSLLTWLLLGVADYYTYAFRLDDRHNSVALVQSERALDQ